MNTLPINETERCLEPEPGSRKCVTVTAFHFQTLKPNEETYMANEVNKLVGCLFIGTDRAFVEVPIKPDRMDWIELPSENRLAYIRCVYRGIEFNLHITRESISPEGAKVIMEMLTMCFYEMCHVTLTWVSDEGLNGIRGFLGDKLVAAIWFADVEIPEACPDCCVAAIRAGVARPCS